MKPGTYDNARSYDQLHKLQTLKFRPHLYKGIEHDKLRGSCGTSALATITGIHPRKIAEKLAPSVKAWGDRPIRRVLSRLGYRTIPLTMCDVTNDDVGWVKYPIRRFHVLLVSQLMVRNEGSWAVIHRNVVYHNQDEGALDPLEFVNNPLMTVYVVWHPKWAVRNPKVFKALEDPLFARAAYNGLNLAKLPLCNMIGYAPQYH